jgi:hypothetical protein
MHKRLVRYELALLDFDIECKEIVGQRQRQRQGLGGK